MPLCILVRSGLGGPHAWALRLRDRLAGERPVYIVCQGPPGGIVTDPDFAYTRARELSAWLRRIAPAIVMPNWIWSAYDVCGIARRAGADLRVVAFCRSDSARTYYDPLAAREHLYDWIVAVSPECRETMAARLPHRADRIRFLATFVERPDMLKRIWQRAPVRVLWAGRFVQEDKRVLDVVPLARKLVDAELDFTLTIAGEGPLALELLDRLAVLRHGGRVRLVGAIRPQDMPHLYLQHDVFVLTSSTEARSNAMLEAMAYGLVPIVTRIRSGVAGVIDDGRTGFLVDVGDTDAFARQIAALASGITQLSKIGAAAYAATAEYSWPRYRTRLNSLLQEIEDLGPAEPERFSTRAQLA